MKCPALALCATALCVPAVALAQENDAELAKKLSNPVASLISVPFQLNYDEGYGPDKGGRVVLNVQPVAPVSLNDDWNLIVRTILPVIYQERTSPTTGSAQGLGDTTQSFFFSPKASRSGLIWAIGPARPISRRSIGLRPMAVQGPRSQPARRRSEVSWRD